MNTVICLFSDKLDLPYFTESILLDLITECETLQDWTKLIRAVGRIFADPQRLLNSFNKSKEEIRSMDVDQDKDSDDTGMKITS